MTRTKVTNSSLAFDSGPLSGFRNAIINGGFDVWQRGTSFTGSEYGADRWITERAGSTCTTSRQSFSLGQTDVPGEPTYFCRFVVGSVTGADNLVVPNQRIEGVRTFAGQTVTLSFWAKADATKFMSVEFSQNFGTGGTPSTRIIEIGVQKFTLTTSWQKFTKTITLPSITGKTLGTNNNNVLQIYFWLDAGSNSNSRTNSLGHQSGTFDIAQVQLESGPVATPFERRPIGTELNLCYRYFQQLGNIIYATIGSGVQQNTTLAAINVPLLQSLRTSSPNISISSLIVTDRTTADAAVSSVNETRVSETSLYLSLAHTAFGAAGRGCLLAPNTNGYLRVSAEL
jgi:hypothetical protein